MKTMIVLLSIFAWSASAKVPASAKSKAGSRLSTDVKFDGQTVGGRVQKPLEALTEVENEKDIDDLIGVRKNFKDRSERAKGLR